MQSKDKERLSGEWGVIDENTHCHTHVHTTYIGISSENTRNKTCTSFSKNGVIDENIMEYNTRNENTYGEEINYKDKPSRASTCSS